MQMKATAVPSCDSIPKADRLRTAVILAGSEGLGLSAARCLAQSGHRIVLFSRSQSKLQTAKASLEGMASDVRTIAGDLASGDDMTRLFAEVEGRFGGVDILVNNTGGPRPGTVLELSEEDWRDAFEEQALSVIQAIRRAVPGMRERGWGRIITIASIAVKAPIAGLDLSNFMRGGLAAIHRTLSRSLAADNVNVHMVLPGSIMTARSKDLIERRAKRMGVSYAEALASSVSQIPKGRLGSPEDVGRVVAFLASDEAAYLTGNFIRVDGGLYNGVD